MTMMGVVVELEVITFVRERERGRIGLLNPRILMIGEIRDVETGFIGPISNLRSFIHSL